MGKKSLLSSTSKKKGGSDSGKEKEKKSKAITGSTQKATRAASKKKTPAGSAAKKRPVSVKELLSKKFDISAPEKQYVPPGDPGRRTEVSSPPFVIGATPEETERIRRLLIKKFDMTYSKAEPNPAPEALSGEIPPSASSASGQEDAGIDESVYSSTEAEVSKPAKKMGSMQKAVIVGILGLVVLLGLVVSASMSNTAKYYLKPANGELEVWKGRFSPIGKKKFVTLSATPMPARPKDTYGKNEIYSFILESYINQADALLNATNMPDFELIKRTLHKAAEFAVSPELNESIQRRLSKINLMALVYKADILADKNTAADLSSARDALQKAMRLNLDEAEKGLVKQKLQGVVERQARLEQMETE